MASNSIPSSRRKPGSIAASIARWIPAFAGMTMIFIGLASPAHAERVRDLAQVAGVRPN